MLNITLITNAGATKIIGMLNQTPGQILEENNVNSTGSTVSLQSRPLSYDDFDRTFEQLNCYEGQNVVLSVIVKADSAC